MFCSADVNDCDFVLRLTTNNLNMTDMAALVSCYILLCSIAMRITYVPFPHWHVPPGR